MARGILDSLTHASAAYLAAALAIQLLELAVGARSWQVLLRAAYPDLVVAYRRTLAAYLAGVGLGAIAPARTAEPVRLYLAKRAIVGSRYRGLAGTLAVEGILDLLLVAAIVIASLQVGVVPSRVIHAAFVRPWLRLLKPLMVVSLAVSFVATALALRHRAGAATVVRRAHEFVAVFHRRVLGRALGWQAIGWTLRLGVVYWFLRAFHIHASTRSVFAVVAAQLVAGLVPVCPGGAGAQQALLLLALRGAAPSSSLLAFGIGSQLLATAEDGLLGLLAVFLTLGPKRFRSAASRGWAACSAHLSRLPRRLRIVAACSS